MLLHHTLSIIGLAVTFIVKLYGTEIVATIFGAEFTNPLLQTRWFLKETNNYSTMLGDIIDISFMVLFGVFRIGIGTVLLYHHYTMSTTDYLSRFGGTCIYIVGWLFWISIVQYAYRKYKRRHDKSKIANVEETDKSLNSTPQNDVQENGHTLAYNNQQEEQNGVLHSEMNGNIHKRHIANGNRITNEVTE